MTQTGVPTTSESVKPPDTELQFWYLGLLTFSFFTLFGNSLVVLSVLKERTLRNATNWFIVSLATADIILAVLVMPVATWMEVSRGRWIFGEVFCNIFVMLDVLFCTASILNLVAIGLDRYIAVSRPLVYAKTNNQKRVRISIALLWAISFLIALPVVCGLNPPRIPDWSICGSNNPVYVITSSLGSFYVPAIVLLAVYHRIFAIIRGRHKLLGKPFSQCSEKQVENNFEKNYSQNQDQSKGKEKIIPDAMKNHILIISLSTDRNDAIIPISTTSGNKVQPDRKDVYQTGTFKEQSVGKTFGVFNCFQKTRTVFKKSNNSDVICGRLNNHVDTVGEQRYETRYFNDIPYENSTKYNEDAEKRCGWGYLCSDVCFTSSSSSSLSIDIRETLYPSSSSSSEVVKLTGAGCKCIECVKVNTRLMNQSKKSIVEQMCQNNVLNGARRSFSEDWTKYYAEAADSKPTESEYVYTKDSHSKYGKSDDYSTKRLVSQSAETMLNTPSIQATEFRRIKKQDFKPSKLIRGRNSFRSSKQRAITLQEQKATKTLAIVLAAFLLCWLPFFTVNVFNGMCMLSSTKKHHSICMWLEQAFPFCTWLGYFNSLINPIIYTIFNLEFRAAFKKLLHLNC